MSIQTPKTTRSAFIISVAIYSAVIGLSIFLMRQDPKPSEPELRKVDVTLSMFAAPETQSEQTSKPEPKLEPKPEPKLEPKPEPKPEPQPEPEPAPKPKPPEPKAASQPLGERIKPQQEAVNEIYGKAKATSKSTSNTQPISDILIAIGLNDRFLFTRELFNNDSALFKSTLTRLNGMSGFDEAMQYLKDHFSWNWEDHHTEHFLQIVKRRFL